jgi:hypothetical protein
MAEGLAGLDTQIKAYENDFAGDAWSDSGHISLGPEIVPISTPAQLDTILQGGAKVTMDFYYFFHFNLLFYVRKQKD